MKKYVRPSPDTFLNLVGPVFKKHNPPMKFSIVDRKVVKKQVPRTQRRHQRHPGKPPAVLPGQKISQGRKLVKKVKIWKGLRLGLPIVENLSVLQESIFNLSRGPQLHFGEKSKK